MLSFSYHLTIMLVYLCCIIDAGPSAIAPVRPTEPAASSAVHPAANKPTNLVVGQTNNNNNSNNNNNNNNNNNVFNSEVAAAPVRPNAQANPMLSHRHFR